MQLTLPKLFIIGAIITILTALSFQQGIMDFSVALWLIIAVTIITLVLSIQLLLVKKDTTGVHLADKEAVIPTFPMDNENPKKDSEEILSPTEARQWLDDFLVEQQTEPKE